MIFDTDVLIWCMRGNTRAAAVIEREDVRTVSIVNYMELVQGARDRRELAMIRSFMRTLGFATLPLTESIGHRAAVYMEEYTLKASLSLADALVAATSVEANETLCSANVKHFKVISELSLKSFRPE